MGTHGDGVQPAVVGVLAVVGAVVDGAADALVGGALAAAVGAVLHHRKTLLFKVELALAAIYSARGVAVYALSFFLKL